MDKAIAATRVRAAFGDAAGTANPLQWLGASSHGLAGTVFSAARLATRSKRRCSHFSGYAAGFGLTEVLVSAVLLGIFSSAGLQLSGSIGRVAKQQHQSAVQQDWLALQLQRDTGLLIRQGALLAVDCSNEEQRHQGMLELQAFWQRAGSIESAGSFPTERQLEIADGLLELRVRADELQRQRDFSLQGLGACINELG